MSHLSRAAKRCAISLTNHTTIWKTNALTLITLETEPEAVVIFPQIIQLFGKPMSF